MFITRDLPFLLVIVITRSYLGVNIYFYRPVGSSRRNIVAGIQNVIKMSELLSRVGHPGAGT